MAALEEYGYERSPEPGQDGDNRNDENEECAQPARQCSAESSKVACGQVARHRDYAHGHSTACDERAEDAD